MKSELHTALYSILGNTTKYSSVLEVYFSFVATIIFEEDWDIVEETLVAEKLNQKYGLKLPSSVIRQVLGVGMNKKAIIDIRGKYTIDKDILTAYCIDEDLAQNFLTQVVGAFITHCKSQDIDISDAVAEERVNQFLQNEDNTFHNIEYISNENEDRLYFEWNRFLKTTNDENQELFNVIAMFRYATTIKEALFCSIDGTDVYNNLNVYLDSPMIFALLGMDDKPRIESCRLLLDEIQKAGCNVYIFDHCYDEVAGILERAFVWATSPNYDISKANNAARYFRNERMQGIEISDYCSSLKNKIDELGIKKQETGYNVDEDDFQEDEIKLMDMILFNASLWIGHLRLVTLGISWNIHIS